MADANCKIHNTPLNGFGTFTFCSECDAENEAQSKYEEEKDSSYIDVEFDSGISTLGYVFYSGSQIADTVFQGDIVVPCGREIFLNRPTHPVGSRQLPVSIYQIKIDPLKTIPHMQGVVRASETICVVGKCVYFRSGRIFIGGRDRGPAS